MSDGPDKSITSDLTMSVELILKKIREARARNSRLLYELDKTRELKYKPEEEESIIKRCGNDDDFSELQKII